ncbi:MAG: MCE family protein [Actinomycetota bacterium]
MKSFLERNQKLIGLVGGLLVLMGTAFALLLTGGVFRDTFVVTAEFADAAGLKAGDDVTVAGLDAGTIGAIEVRDGVVQVELKVDQGVKMPADSEAEIVIETLLGRKSVALHGGSSDRLLADGDRITVDDTTTPVELLHVANTSRPLLERSDPQALQDLMNRLTAITKGKRRQVGTLITGLADVTQVIDERSSELSRLLDSFDILSGTFAEKDETLVSLIDNLNLVLANLDERSDDLERLLEATDTASHETADLVMRNRSQLDGALGGLHTALTTLDKHQVDLAATISYLEQSVQGYSSVGYSQGTPNRWANIFVQSLGPVGIDAFFGPCGAFDQALDQLLGPDPRDCPDRAEYGDQDPEDGGPQGGGAGRSAQPAPPRQEPGDGLPEAPLPGDIGDLIDDATGDVDLIDALRGSLP